MAGLQRFGFIGAGHRKTMASHTERNLDARNGDRRQQQEGLVAMSGRTRLEGGHPFQSKRTKMRLSGLCRAGE